MPLLVVEVATNRTTRARRVTKRQEATHGDTRSRATTLVAKRDMGEQERGEDRKDQ
jgi:hypothetical protein